MSLTPEVKISLAALLALAVLLNLLFIRYTTTRRVGTRLCVQLLRCQAVIDSVLVAANLLGIEYLHLLPSLSQSLPDSVWYLYCKTVESYLLYWSLVCMSVWNQVCLSTERYFCLCRPFWYRRHRRRLLVAFAAVVAAAPFVVEVPYCWLGTELVRLHGDDAANQTLSLPPWSSTKACNGSFQPELLFRCLALAYVSLFWLAPFLLTVLLYAQILRRISDSAALRRHQAVEALTVGLPNGATTTAANRRVGAAARRLTAVTATSAAAFALLFALDSVTFLLYNLGVNVGRNPALEELDSCLVALNSAASPLAYLVFMPGFRRHLLGACRPVGGASTATGGGGASSGPSTAV